MSTTSNKSAKTLPRSTATPVKAASGTPASAPASTPPAAAQNEAGGLVEFKTAENEALSGELYKIIRSNVVLFLRHPNYTPQFSESLKDFRITVKDRLIYNGSAIVSKVLDMGDRLVCEVSLQESGWTGLALGAPTEAAPDFSILFRDFIQGWQKSYRLLPEFKSVVTDLRSFLHALSTWLEQVENRIHTEPVARQAELELKALKELKTTLSPIFTGLFGQFEQVACRVPKEEIPQHTAFCHEQLHQYLLDSPFTHRIYSKPMGYAGDHEMIDMIIRNQYEGRTMFSKLLHSYIIEQAPAISVRNRAVHFTRRFVQEYTRVSQLGRTTQFCSLGCGPAREVDNFMREYPQSDRTGFRLLDFSQETLDSTSRRLESTKQKFGRRTAIRLVRKPAQYLLKDNKPIADESGYDMIYCSGLYDYLSDRVCKNLNTFLYDQLLPGGVLVVTNFDPSNPIRGMMEYFFDWFLIHRNSREMAEMAPEQAAPENCRVIADATGCNVFLEARKPI